MSNNSSHPFLDAAWSVLLSDTKKINDTDHGGYITLPSGQVVGFTIRQTPTGAVYRDDECAVVRFPSLRDAFLHAMFRAMGTQAHNSETIGEWMKTAVLS